MKIVKYILYNFLFIYLCRWILFGVYKIDDYASTTNVTYCVVSFFISFMVYNNLLLYFDKIKQIFIGAAILVVPYLSISFVQWLMVKFKLVKTYKDVDFLNIHLFNYQGVSYYLIAVSVIMVVVDICFFVRKDKNDKTKETKLREPMMIVPTGRRSIGKSYKPQHVIQQDPREQSTTQSSLDDDLTAIFIIVFIIATGAFLLFKFF